MAKEKETHIYNRDVRWWSNQAIQVGKKLDKAQKDLVAYRNHVEKLEKKIKKLKKKLKKKS